MKVSSLFLFVCVLALVVGCQDKRPKKEFKVKEIEKPILGRPGWDPNTAKASDPLEGLSDIERGQHIYLKVCIQCHNKDPNQVGSVGPQVVDAPLEVMTAKVMTGKYPDPLPAGFIPKRSTKNMRALPQYQDEIPNIWAWVQSVKK